MRNIIEIWVQLLMVRDLCKLTDQINSECNFKDKDYTLKIKSSLQFCIYLTFKTGMATCQHLGIVFKILTERVL